MAGVHTAIEDGVKEDVLRVGDEVGENASRKLGGRLAEGQGEEGLDRFVRIVGETRLSERGFILVVVTLIKMSQLSSIYRLP